MVDADDATEFPEDKPPEKAKISFKGKRNALRKRKQFSTSVSCFGLYVGQIVVNFSRNTTILPNIAP